MAARREIGGRDRFGKIGVIAGGEGAATVKSAALLSVSLQPPPLRMAAVVFVRGAVAVPSKQFAA